MIDFSLPATTVATANHMFFVAEDDKLRVQSPLHELFEGSQVKALDRVVSVNGHDEDEDPKVLLTKCVDDGPVELKLRRDPNNNIS